MVRFVIRNYGPSRKVPYKDMHVFIGQDKAIETDDAELANAFASVPKVTVKARPGVPTSPVPVSTPDPEKGVIDEPVEDDDFDEPVEDDDEFDGEDDDDEEDESIDYDSMLKRDLLTLARERDVDLPEKITKKDLIELLKESENGN